MKTFLQKRTSRRVLRDVCLAVILGGCAAPALAAETATPVGNGGMEFELAPITVEAKRPDWEAKLSPGTVTVIRPEEFKGEQKTLPDMLKTVPGVHVREVNGHGQYTTVTVRGSTAAQVGVFIDGVLTNLGGDAAVDISTIPVKNVERIEVYRGYIPARFGGTYIGGVINIVTKKPTKTGVNAEVGKSSFGGDSISGEITTPLGNGTLMVTGSYEDSDGDFRYRNYAADRYVPALEKYIVGNRDNIDNFNTKKIDELTSTKDTNGNDQVPVISLSKDQIDTFKANPEAWENFVRTPGDDGLAGYIDKNEASRKANASFANVYPDIQARDADAANPNIEKYYTDQGFSEDPNNINYWQTEAQQDWVDGTGAFDSGVKQELIDDYIKRTTGDSTAAAVQDADPATSKTLAAYKEQLKENQKKLKEASDNKRWRKYNDHKNSDVMVKWQNQNWTVKGSWNEIDRHLPDGVWGGDINSAVPNSSIDLYDMYHFDSRHQKITNKELMVQNRNQNGRLEWGWMADFLNSNKRYRAEHITNDLATIYEAINVPLREWSRYKSNKYNFQVDGTYKLSDRNMLDFQANYSHERMHVYGSLMDKVLGDSDLANVLGQTRNKYDQDIFNVQLQDTITLDRKGTWFLTPSVRYNQSTITGYSDGKRFETAAANNYPWLHPKDKQRDSKTTWQLALKKEVNDNLTLRMTGGTYYRLLNMYEIAGDGAGILPAPNNDRNSAFPKPESGKQFDMSAIWRGKVLHADNSTTVTYFWRDTDNMLQLTRMGKDYWSYLNDNKGKAHGFEIQSNFSWKKFDLDLRATYIQSHLQRRNSSVGYAYTDIWATYQPEWEANVRLTYRPNQKIDLFGELHYTDEYYTAYNKDSRGGEYAYLSGHPVSSLTTINGGIKWKPAKSWQLTFGCNDIFNRAEKMKIKSNTAFTEPGYVNIEYPIQGRTYYATVRYQF